MTVFDLEGRRKQRLNDLAILLQKTYRGWHHWNRVSLLLSYYIDRLLAVLLGSLAWRGGGGGGNQDPQDIGILKTIPYKSKATL